MATRNSTREAAAADSDATAGAHTVADATRQQMASSASAASAMLRSLDVFHQTQQHMLQRAALLQEQTAERLRQASTPMELLSIQSSLMMASLTELAQYSQEMMLASLKAQNEFMRPGDQQQQTAAGAATQAASAAAASPLFQAWQAVFTAPMNGAASLRPH
ncbi:phasin family protein [Ramlibacter sp. AW1]|uniref:Phasin family protein n=1 Tax=Ramlibacter aurantiacus TaxID=2801330 RepID=A0A936ZTN5_9BURK|nr:phasin family protein [Ramlibacter aurantiacus]MBL0422351.1 phasin family protein [Ramlibacter aurantiacus]